MSMFRLTFVFR